MTIKYRCKTCDYENTMQITEPKNTTNRYLNEPPDSRMTNSKVARCSKCKTMRMKAVNKYPPQFISLDHVERWKQERKNSESKAISKTAYEV